MEKLQRAGLKVEQPELLRVAIQRDEQKKVVRLRGEVPVMGNEGLMLVTLKPVTKSASTALPPTSSAVAIPSSSSPTST